MKSKIKEETMSKLIEENMMKIQKDVSNLKRDFKKLVLRNEMLPREFKIPKVGIMLKSRKAHASRN